MRLVVGSPLSGFTCFRTDLSQLIPGLHNCVGSFGLAICTHSLPCALVVRRARPSSLTFLVATLTTGNSHNFHPLHRDEVMQLFVKTLTGQTFTIEVRRRCSDTTSQSMCCSRDSAIRSVVCAELLLPVFSLHTRGALWRDRHAAGAGMTCFVSCLERRRTCLRAASAGQL